MKIKVSSQYVHLISIKIISPTDDGYGGKRASNSDLGSFYGLVSIKGASLEKINDYLREVLEAEIKFPNAVSRIFDNYDLDIMFFSYNGRQFRPYAKNYTPRDIIYQCK